MSEFDIDAETIIGLKIVIGNEMGRRKGYGSLEEYSGTDYNFSTAPTKTGIIRAEQGEKTVNLLLMIKDITGVNKTQEGKILPNAEGIINALMKYTTETMEGETSSCRGACTGLCAGSCIGGCNGCSGKCDSGCQGCTASCGSGCAGSSMYA